jgi:FAD:protein FMN transferase
MRSSVLFLFFVFITMLLLIKANIKNDKEISLSGLTMGSIVYNIKYISEDSIIDKNEVDSLLISFNNIFSTYIPDSYISVLNKSKSIDTINPYFYFLLKESKKIYRITEGAFDPTIGPLINAWGFGPKSIDDIPSKEEIFKINKLVGFDKLYFDENIIEKHHEDVYLDFSSIAKGYAIDLISGFFNNKNIENYFIDIGGEVRCKGRNSKNKIWKIGIETPSILNNSRQLIATVKLDNLSLATSGNYRNYYMQNDTIIAHTINPKTGYPAKSNILSASVFSKDCFISDAYATAFMVLGYEKAKEISKNNRLIDVLLIYENSEGNIETYISNNLNSLIEYN